MKKCVVIFGPPAVGKMTVGKELAKLTNLKLFHNHMTIELVLPFFDFGTPEFHKLSDGFRRQVFEEVAVSDKVEGLIFTYVWDLDDLENKDFLDSLTSYFKKAAGEVYYVELEASQSERLKRNVGEDRLLEKPSKRDIEKSNSRLIENDHNHKLNLDVGDNFFYKNYIKINNEDLGPKEVARKIYDFLESE